MVDNHHFSEALEVEYGKLTGDEPTDDIRIQFHKMVAEINRKHPETYLAHGVRNGVRKAFERGISRLKWDATKIQAMGTSSIRRFTRQEEVVELLEEFNLRPDQLDLLECVVGILRELTPESPLLKWGSEQPAKTGKDRMSFADLVRAAEEITPGISTEVALAVATAAPALAKTDGPQISAKATPQKAPAINRTSDADLQAAVALGDIEQGELNKRKAQQERVRDQIFKREEDRLDENIDEFVEMGILSQEEAGQVRALREVDGKLKCGEIGEREADRIRNSILRGEARSKLEHKVREVIDHAVIYLQVHQAMQRINPSCDQSLTYLIRNKEAVTAADSDAQAAAAKLQNLMDDVPLLEGLVDIMERKDQEIRMLSVRLPPYNAIAGRGLEKVGNMMIDENFVTDLRSMDEEAISARLNSADKNIRVKPAAAMRCFISLVDHLTKRTPFRKQIRIFRVALTLERFFRDTPNLKEARHQAEHYLQRQLRRLFPDMSPEESREIKQRGANIINDIEQRMLSDRQENVEAKRQQADEQPEQKTASSAVGGEDMELSAEEQQKGVQIGRVETRIGGGMRRIPLKIMPDEEEPSLYVVVQRDPESGELVPQMRRGQKRLVEKGKDGMWRPFKG